MHAVPHIPQWLLSVIGLTHVPPQSVVPVLQTHAPAVHVLLALQTLSQRPQCSRVLCVSTQSAPHIVCAHVFMHAPIEQNCVPAHAVPHAPQLARSDRGSTHAPPHRVMGAAQIARQMPSAHSCPAAHTVPHAPQWLVDVCVSTH